MGVKQQKGGEGLLASLHWLMTARGKFLVLCLLDLSLVDESMFRMKAPVPGFPSAQKQRAIQMSWWRTLQVRRPLE
jgi:hypothetical protein